MLYDLEIAIKRADDAARNVGLQASQIERYAGNDPECVAICAMISSMCGEYRDRLSTLRLDPLERVKPS